MINSRKIEDLQPYVHNLCKLLISKCKDEGIEILVTSTLRDAEYQKALYAQGRTKPGNKVTSTAVIGAHGFGLAFDIVPVVNGKPDWSSNKWQRIGAIGKSIGLEWAGDWETFIEKCHFQYTQGLTNAQLRAGRRPKLPPVQNESVKEVDDLFKYPLKPIAKGRILNYSTLECCSKPSNSARTGHYIKKENEPFNIFAKCSNEGAEWYLVNATTEQWVAAHHVKLEVI